MTSSEDPQQLLDNQTRNIHLLKHHLLQLVEAIEHRSRYGAHPCDMLPGISGDKHSEYPPGTFSWLVAPSRSMVLDYILTLANNMLFPNRSETWLCASTARPIEFTWRALRSMTHVHAERMIRGNLSRQDWVDMKQVADQLVPVSMAFAYDVPLTPAYVAESAREFAKHKPDLSLVIVEACDMVCDKDAVTCDVAEAASSLKDLAKELNVHVRVVQDCAKTPAVPPQCLSDDPRYDGTRN